MESEVRELMAYHTYAPINIVEAKSYADLTGVKYDLEVALRFIELLEAEFTQVRPNSDLVQALTVAILVQYSRAFTSGYRGRLGNSDIESLSEADQRLHKRYSDWRDKHVAHSVNPFEQNQVVARFVSERVREEGVYDVSVQQTRLVSVGTSDLESLRHLIAKMTSIVDGKLGIEHDDLLTVVQRLPIEQVLSGAGHSQPETGIESAGERRTTP